MTGGSTNERAHGGVSEARAFAVGGSLVLALVAGILAVSYMVAWALGLPGSLGLPPVAKVSGAAVAAAGLAMAGWTFSARSPADMIRSTYVTLTKALTRTPVSESAGRTERLVVSGPQKYTRNPLYFGVMLLVFGWGLFADATYLFVAVVAFLAWVWLVLIPYEERELKALFGEEWTKYSRETPMLVPFTKRRKNAQARS